MTMPAPPFDPFPAVMVASCAHGHQWRVQVTWTPIILREDGTWDPRVQSPDPAPRHCAQCFASDGALSPAIGLLTLADERDDEPSCRIARS